MAILNLAHGQEKYLKDMICRANPELIDYPDSFFTPLGDVIDNHDGTCTVFLTGEPGSVEDQQVSGKASVTYKRLNLTTFFKNIPNGLFANKPTSTLQLIPLIEEQFGIAFDPDDVHDDPLPGTESGTTLVRFKFPPGRSFVLDLPEFMISWEKSRTIRLNDVFTVSALNGHVPEIPFLTLIEGIFSITELNGLTPETVVPNWTKLSTGWFIPSTEWALLDEVFYWTAGGGYNADTLAALINKASQGKFGNFVCDDTATRPNLWNSGIVGNGSNSEYCGFQIPSRKLTITPPAEVSGGMGEMAVFYDLIRLDKEEFVLADDQTVLRQWLSSLVAPATTWDVTKAPLLFNTVTQNKFGTWIAADNSQRIRNLWWSGLTSNGAGSWTVDGETYNRKAVWTLSGDYSNTSTGPLTVYYNAA